ncbi:TPA: ead/Ea22-like family protein [Pseudomonas aeruginosa]|nr:ead/Ea22-like family protein [Pseudomonas aeruginosa]
MTDHAELRRVAAQAHPDAEWFIARNLDHPNIDKPAASFIAAVNPKTVLALLDEIDRLKAENDRLRQGMKGDYDIDAWLDWSKEKERIKAENESLLDELSACTEHPGGCGYWREAAKRRTEERDQFKEENDALRGALQAVVDDPTWRSNDNTLWPKIIKAMDKGTTK